MGWYGDWKPYVPVAKRRAQAASFASKLAKKEGRKLSPVQIEGRKIAKTFWGQAWCQNLESYSDYANRLPRGSSYVRNGSVIDLQIKPGTVEALVSGSQIYTVKIAIQKLAKPSWERIKQACSQSIHSLIDLLQGRLSDGIMQRLTERDGGLFPQPKEIKMSCSCPDWAGVCKHVAATMYGVGARLDTAPDLLFTLRAVDHLELISQAVAAENLDQTLTGEPDSTLAGNDLGELFGIDLEVVASQPKDVQPSPRKKTATTKSIASTASKTRGKPAKPEAEPTTKLKSGKKTRKKATVVASTESAPSATKVAKRKAR